MNFSIFLLCEIYPSMVIPEQHIFIITDPAAWERNQNSFQQLDFKSLLLQIGSPADKSMLKVISDHTENI